MNNIKQLAVLISVLSLSAGAGMADQPKHGGGGGSGGSHGGGSHGGGSHGGGSAHHHHSSGGNVWVNSVLPSVIMSVLAPRPVVIVSPIVPMAPVYYSEPAPVYYNQPAPVYYNQPAPVICHTAPVYIAPRLVYDPYVSPVIIYAPERGYHYQYRQRLVNGSW